MSYPNILPAWLVKHCQELSRDPKLSVTAVFKRKSSQELLEERKRRHAWLRTPEGQRSLHKSRMRAQKIREGKLRVDPDRSKLARRVHNIYGGNADAI